MPRSLGNVPVPAPGTRVQVTATAQTFCKQFTVQGVKAGGVNNTGIVAVGLANMVLATGVGVLFYILPGDLMTYGFTSEAMDMSLIYIDAVNAADAGQFSIGG